MHTSNAWAALRCTLPLVLFAAALAPAHASVILNAADPASGFYNGYTYDYGDPASNVPIAAFYTSALPSVDGFAGMKAWGSASLDDNNGLSPYFWGKAGGSASGTLDQDSYLMLSWNFTSPNLPDVPWWVGGAVTTSNGSYLMEITDPASVNGQTANGSAQFVKNGSITLVPAGTEIYTWQIAIWVGEYGNATLHGPFSVDIPQNSLDLYAAAVSPTAPAPGPGPNPVPEPSTWAMAGAGILLLGVSRRRR